MKKYNHIQDDNLINWDTIDETFNYVAVDSDGWVYAFENKPYTADGFWDTEEYSEHDKIIDIVELEVGDDWKELLWERPPKKSASESKIIELNHTDHYEWYVEDEDGWRIPIEMLNDKFIITVTPK